MKELQITYSTFKTIKNKFNIEVFYYELNPGYSIYLTSKEFIYNCSALTQAEMNDFENNYKNTSVLCESKDDAIALSTIPSEWSYSGYNIAMKGVFIEGKCLTVNEGASAGCVEWYYDTDIELQGIDCETGETTVCGDSLTLTIEHPLYGEIRRFGENYLVSPNRNYREISERVDTIPAGIRIRVAYNALDTNGRKCALRLRSFK